MKHLLITTMIGAALHAGAAEAAFVLDFEGASDGAQLLDFYNGGTDSAGNSGANFGVQFGANALAIIDQDAGGSGNFANEPSPNTTMSFVTGSAVLNYSAGFDTGFSFFYSSVFSASVTVWDGLDASGNLLATLNLISQFDDNCTGDPTGDFCNWTEVGASFAGTAKSIDFSGTVNSVGFDDITFGSASAGGATIPEPASLALLGLGLLGLNFASRRKAA